MRHERWVGASVNEQKGREERESDSCLYYVAVTKTKKEYIRHIYSTNIVKQKHFSVSLFDRVSRARIDF